MTHRSPITIRLHGEDKELFDAAAAAAGMETVIAARQILELVCRRLRDGVDLFDVAMALQAITRRDQRVRKP